MVPVNINDRAREAAEAFAKKFDQLEIDESEGDDEGAEGASGDPQA